MNAAFLLWLLAGRQVRAPTMASVRSPLIPRAAYNIYARRGVRRMIMKELLKNAHVQVQGVRMEQKRLIKTAFPPLFSSPLQHWICIRLRQSTGCLLSIMLHPSSFIPLHLEMLILSILLTRSSFNLDKLSQLSLFLIYSFSSSSLTLLAFTL